VKWFKNFKVGAKLIIGFSVMILFMGVIGFTGYRSVSSIEHCLEDIFSVRLPGIDYIIQADRDLQQLLVAERSMIFANAKSDVFKAFVEEYEENLKQSEDRWEKYKALATTAEEKAIVPNYEAARQEWKAISRRVVDGRVADTRQGRRVALDLTLGQAKEKFEAMRDYLDQLTRINLEMAQKAHQAAAATYRNTLIVLFVTTGIGLLVGLALMWSMGQGIAAPLRRVIAGLTESAHQVAAGSGQMATSSQSLAEGSAEQAASLEETSSSLEEMASMTKQNANNASEADGLMKEANQTVGKANGSMEELTTSMGEISKASEETSKIIKTIDEIAFQTNLLALNAAVEAARAGEAGAGFAVVADEVRNLAMRAADAAKNTAGLIEGTVKKVKDGSELVIRTNDAFGEVAKSTAKVGELVSEISAASNEQAQGIEQVNRTVSEMDRVVQQAAANAEESASASEEMNAQAEHMNGFIDELVGLVGSNEKEQQATRQAPVHHDMIGTTKAQAPRQKAMSTPAGTTTKQPSMEHIEKKTQNPEDVIPLDDHGDFKDF
jgi:methyl-accepting chemotaxis protein